MWVVHLGLRSLSLGLRFLHRTTPLLQTHPYIGLRWIRFVPFRHTLSGWGLHIRYTICSQISAHFPNETLLLVSRSCEWRGCHFWYPNLLTDTPFLKSAEFYAHQRVTYSGITDIVQSPFVVTYAAPHLGMALGVALTKKAPLSGWKVLCSMHLLFKRH